MHLRVYICNANKDIIIIIIDVIFFDMLVLHLYHTYDHVIRYLHLEQVRTTKTNKSP